MNINQCSYGTPQNHLLTRTPSVISVFTTGKRRRQPRTPHLTTRSSRRTRQVSSSKTNATGKFWTWILRYYICIHIPGRFSPFKYCSDAFFAAKNFSAISVFYSQTPLTTLEKTSKILNFIWILNFEISWSLCIHSLNFEFKVSLFMITPPGAVTGR